MFFLYVPVATMFDAFAKIDSNGRMINEGNDLRFSVAILSGDKAAALVLVLGKTFLKDEPIIRTVMVTVTYGYLYVVTSNLDASQRCSIELFGSLLPMKYVLVAFNALAILFTWWPTPGHSALAFHAHYGGTALIIAGYALSQFGEEVSAWMSSHLGLVTHVDKNQKERATHEAMARSDTPIHMRDYVKLQLLPGEHSLSLTKERSLKKKRQACMRTPARDLAPGVCGARLARSSTHCALTQGRVYPFSPPSPS